LLDGPDVEGMGRVMAHLKLSNSHDEENVRRGIATDIRAVEIEALVDTGATTLVLPIDVVEQLGLAESGKRKVRYADGSVAEVPWVGGIKLEILGREGIFSALVHARGTRPLLGQIPLEELDLLVDPKTREVRVNPESPDAPMLEIMRAATAA
jgi:clan AA aspartic protease